MSATDIVVLRYEQPATQRHPAARSGHTTAEGISQVLARAWRARRVTVVYDGDDIVAAVEKAHGRWAWWSLAEYAGKLAQPRPEQGSGR